MEWPLKNRRVADPSRLLAGFSGNKPCPSRQSISHKSERRVISLYIYKCLPYHALKHMAIDRPRLLKQPVMSLSHRYRVPQPVSTGLMVNSRDIDVAARYIQTSNLLPVISLRMCPLQIAINLLHILSIGRLVEFLQPFD